MDGDVMDLGHDHTASYAQWAPDRSINPQYVGLPDVERWGLLVDHLRPDGTPCVGSFATFSGPVQQQIEPDRPVWTVESFEPLTLSPSLLCRLCGDHGFVRQGQWVPA